MKNGVKKGSETLEVIYRDYTYSCRRTEEKMRNIESMLLHQDRRITDLLAAIIQRRPAEEIDGYLLIKKPTVKRKTNVRKTKKRG